MRFCKKHWDARRAEVIALGMESLIAKTGEEIAAKTMQALEAGSSKSTFDPLMGAHNAILSNALNAAGLAIMLPNEDGSDRCPQCFLQADHDRACKDPNCPGVSFDKWTQRAAADMLEEAKKLGLVSSS